MTTEQPSSPPPAPSAPSAGGAPAVAPGQIVAGLGAIALIVSAFLNWQDVLGHTAKGTDVPVEFLVDKGVITGDPSILIALAIAGAMVIVGLFLPQLRVLAILGGALGVIVVVLYCVQVQRLIDASSTSIGLFDFIAIGTYIAFVGGIAAVVGSALARRA